jgi:protein TonB
VHRPPTVEQDVPSFVAPVQVPEEIAPEDPGLGLGIEDGDGVGVEGGVPGGVVGGLVGGLADSPPPPQAVRVGGDVVAPRKIHDVGPVYPELARQAGVQGMVILECGIDERGRVTNVDVLRGVSLLNQAAIAAVKQWIYTPTLIAGRATPIVMTVTVRFALEGVR